jgi:hypothetical protein
VVVLIRVLCECPYFTPADIRSHGRSLGLPSRPFPKDRKDKTDAKPRALLTTYVHRWFGYFDSRIPPPPFVCRFDLLRHPYVDLVKMPRTKIMSVDANVHGRQNLALRQPAV